MLSWSNYSTQWSKWNISECRHSNTTVNAAWTAPLAPVSLFEIAEAPIFSRAQSLP